ncbi:MAG TPA: TonB-dependent receptor plug domain-containing protein, partial [Archangium sp.]|nr:TonB-dependent receptor plug domain-containing protein [Archangium sp.]
MNRTLSLSASLLALLIPPGTQAQSAPASTEAPTPVAQEVRPLQPAPTALEGQTVISGDELRRVPSESLVQALRGRLPLASFGPDSGSAGSALQLWGLPSLLTGVSPLYVVDGVLLGPEFSNLDTSPLHQLNTYDVERLELLTGAVATGRYGQRGAGGVFVITTRRAQPGPLQVRLSQRVGLSQLSRKLGSRTFTTQEEAIAVFGERARDYYQPGRVFDHEQQLAGRLGPSVETLLELGGGSERTRYFLSGLFKHDTGIVANTGYGKQGLKLGLDQEVSRSVRFSATAHLLHSVMRRAYSPYQLLTSTPNFLDLSARKDGTYPAHPFLATGANPLELTTSYNDEEDGWRVMGSARLDATLWSAGAHTLELMVQGGLNGTQQSGHTHHVLASERPSWRSDSSGMTRALNGQLELRYQLRPESGGLALQTAAGLLLDARWLDGKSSLVPPGSPPSGPNDGATRYIGAGAGGAAFLRASGQLFQERLLVDAALRAEKWSAFGSLSPMASLGYRLLVPRGPLDELRPRLTYSVLEDKRYANLPPERRRELELGVDVLALEGKARLGVRAWQQHLTDFHVLLQQTSTTTGSPLHQEAGGELLGRGVEAALEVVPIQGERLQWTSRTLFGLSRTRVEQLPAPF